MFKSCLRALQEVTQDTFKSGKGVKVGMDIAAATSWLTGSNWHCCLQHLRVMGLRVGEQVYAQGISLSFGSRRGGVFAPTEAQSPSSNITAASELGRVKAALANC